MAPPVPMGEDGYRRVVNYVESMRSITLKCSMIRTLLRHHQNDWRTLGAYLPQTFFIASKGCGAREDERVPLLYMARRAELAEPEVPLWIAKSSAGCHGKNIRIFRGDTEGVQEMCDYIDAQGESSHSAANGSGGGGGGGGHKSSGGGALWVAQRYVDRPLLFHRRKFDIRCLALLRCDDFSIYVHRELVMRLSSVEYSRETALCERPEDVFAHITNHCIQTEADNYAAYEEDNELWREHLDGLVRFRGRKLLKERRERERRAAAFSPTSSSPAKQQEGVGVGDAWSWRRTLLSRYGHRFGGDNRGVENTEKEEEREAEDLFMPSTSPHSHSMQEPTLANTILPQMHYIIKDTIFAGRSGIPVSSSPPTPTHSFQLFGYDFIIDEDLHVWLLEINGAPGIAGRLVEQVASDIIDIAVLPHFPVMSSGPRGAASRDGRGGGGGAPPHRDHAPRHQPSRHRSKSSSRSSRSRSRPRRLHENGFERIYPTVLRSDGYDFDEEEEEEDLEE